MIYFLTIVVDAILMDGLVLYKHVCLWDTLMANPIAGWQRGYCLLFPFLAAQVQQI